MKTVIVSDLSLKQIARRSEETPLFRKKQLISSLCALGVDSIELPAIQNPKEDWIVNRIIASQAKDCRVCIPVGHTVESVRDAWACVSECVSPCLQIAYPLSTVQLEYTYHQKAAQAMVSIAELIAHAKSLCETVEFVAGDVTRADRETIEAAVKVACEQGATSFTVCDDTESVLPEELADLISFIRPLWRGELFVKVSNRNLMGLASAIAAVAAGADGIKASIFGEDALPLSGIANLYHVRGNSLGFALGLNVTSVEQTVNTLLRKETSTLAPALTTDQLHGIRLAAGCTLGEVADAVSALGYDLSDEDCGKVHEEIQRVNTKKEVIGERELEAIIAGAAMAVPSTYHVETYVINSGNVLSSTAQIALTRDGQQLNGVSIGDGPIDAAFHAIEQIIGHHYELEDFQIQAVTRGREALGSALVKLRSNGRLYSGNGVSTDIVGASIRAYVNALNKIVYEEG